MMRSVPLLTPSNLTTAVNLPFFRRRSGSTFQYNRRRFFSDTSPQTRVSELPRVDSLVDGSYYKHWAVIMHPPENYPQREEIIQQYIATLSMALGSEKAAMESIYSVSTKHYYAFSSLPRVKWFLPDSYLCGEESGYGGEPFIDRVDWLQKDYGVDYMGRICSKPRMRRRPSVNSRATK